MRRMSDQPQYPTYPDYQQQYQPPQYPVAPPPKSGGMGKWIALGGCGCLFFMAVIVGVVYFVFQMTKAPMQAVNDHLAAIREGSVEKAYNECSSGFKQETSLQQFQSFLSGYPFFKTTKGFTSSNSKTENGITTLEGNVECSDGSKHPEEYRLVKDGTTFRVQYINVKEAAVPSQQQSVKQPIERNPHEETKGQESSEGGLTIFDVRIDKSQGEMVNVVVAFQVKGFQNSHTGDTYSLNLVQDLETLGPDGIKVNSLSQDAIKTLNESGAGEYTSANFSNTLQIPTSFPHGTYTVNLRVHDQVGGTTATSSTTFELP